MGWLPNHWVGGEEGGPKKKLQEVGSLLGYLTTENENENCCLRMGCCGGLGLGLLGTLLLALLHGLLLVM